MAPIPCRPPHFRAAAPGRGPHGQAPNPLAGTPPRRTAGPRTLSAPRCPPPARTRRPAETITHPLTGVSPTGEPRISAEYTIREFQPEKSRYRSHRAAPSPETAGRPRTGPEFLGFPRRFARFTGDPDRTPPFPAPPGGAPAAPRRTAPARPTGRPVPGRADFRPLPAGPERLQPLEGRVDAQGVGQ